MCYCEWLWVFYPHGVVVCVPLLAESSLDWEVRAATLSHSLTHSFTHPLTHSFTGSKPLQSIGSSGYQFWQKLFSKYRITYSCVTCMTLRAVLSSGHSTRMDCQTPGGMTTVPLEWVREWDWSLLCGWLIVMMPSLVYLYSLRYFTIDGVRKHHVSQWVEWF
jgi:hypothetical protein